MVAGSNVDYPSYEYWTYKSLFSISFKIFSAKSSEFCKVKHPLLDPWFYSPINLGCHVRLGTPKHDQLLNTHLIQAKETFQKSHETQKKFSHPTTISSNSLISNDIR